MHCNINMYKPAGKHLSDYLAAKGLRSTSQRDAILELFLEAGRHLSAEELYDRVKKSHPGISYATVYRTLKLLVEAGLAKENHFDDGYTRFEYNSTDGHHDHLICTRCGEIVEFENDKIEALQLDVAKQNGYKVQNHKLEIYGLCSKCQRKPAG
jgi:Fur family ferric uptake transcriptional regulator